MVTDSLDSPDLRPALISELKSRGLDVSDDSPSITGESDTESHLNHSGIIFVTEPDTDFVLDRSTLDGRQIGDAESLMLGKVFMDAGSTGKDRDRVVKGMLDSVRGNFPSKWKTRTAELERRIARNGGGAEFIVSWRFGRRVVI